MQPDQKDTETATFLYCQLQTKEGGKVRIYKGRLKGANHEGP